MHESNRTNRKTYPCPLLHFAISNTEGWGANGSLKRLKMIVGFETFEIAMMSHRLMLDFIVKLLVQTKSIGNVLYNINMIATVLDTLLQNDRVYRAPPPPLLFLCF
jgi:hypothetical protein